LGRPSTAAGGGNFESRVLAGAAETLGALHPALVIEVCDEALRTCQSSAERLLTELYDRWYSAFRTTHKGIAGPLTASRALRAHKTRNYIDVLLLHERI